MLFLAVVVLVLGAAFGASSLLVVWPLAVLAATVLYCVDRPARRACWPPATVALIGAALAFHLAVGDARPSTMVKVLVLVVPLLIAALVISAAGGPRRIRLRHERAEAERRRVRAEAVARRRALRKQSVKQRTGVDVDLLAEVTRDRAGRLTRAVGGQLNRGLERRRPRPAAPSGAPDLLDLDQDVAAHVSQQQRDEIRRLASRLGREQS